DPLRARFRRDALERRRPRELAEHDAAEMRADRLVHPLAETMGSDRIAEKTLEPDPARFLLRERAEPLEQMAVSMGRRDGGVAALGGGAGRGRGGAGVPQDAPRLVEGDERDELSGLVQRDEPVRIVEIGVAVGVAERPIHALRDADRVRRTKAAYRVRLR